MRLQGSDAGRLYFMGACGGAAAHFSPAAASAAGTCSELAEKSLGGAGA